MTYFYKIVTTKMTKHYELLVFFSDGFYRTWQIYKKVLTQYHIPLNKTNMFFFSFHTQRKYQIVRKSTDIWMLNIIMISSFPVCWPIVYKKMKRCTFEINVMNFNSKITLLSYSSAIQLPNGLPFTRFCILCDS